MDKNLKDYYIGVYEIACKNGYVKTILYRNRFYEGAFYAGKCYILNSKDELIDITDKKYKIIN